MGGGLVHVRGLVALAAVLLAALLALVLTVHGTTWLDHVDVALDHRLRPGSQAAIAAPGGGVAVQPALAVAVAELGDGQVIGAIAVLVTAASALATRRLRLVWVAALILAALIGAVEGGKNLLGRAAPGLAGDSPHLFGVGGVSFPSGHSSGTLVVYGLVAALLCGPAGIRPSRVGHAWLTVAACLISATVGILTVVIDWHWPTDVVGGWLLGGTVLIAGNLLLAGRAPGSGHSPA